MPEQGVNFQGPSLRCRPPPHPSGRRGTRQLPPHPWVLPPAGCPGPPALRGRATQLPPAVLHLTPLEKGSMGLGRTRKGVIPARGKSFIQPLAEGTYCPGQEGTPRKKPQHPSRLFREPWQDTPCLPPLCPLGDGGRAGHPCARRGSQSLLQPAEQVRSNTQPRFGRKRRRAAGGC